MIRPALPGAMAWLLVFGLAAVAVFGSGTGSAAAAPPGNNGTVKVHDSGTEDEPVVNDEPQVCTFHLHGFFFDPGQDGTWWIESWAPTGTGSTVLSGTYTADAQGEFRMPAAPGTYSLDEGHFKLFLQGIGDESHEVKHKVFWVECAPPPPPVQPGTLVVRKVVVNASGGTKRAIDFAFSVSGGVASGDSFLQVGTDPLSGMNGFSVDPGTYTVTEDGTPIESYVTTYDNCANVSVGVGQTATCTITNTSSAGSGGGGGGGGGVGGGGGGGGGGNPPVQPQPVLAPTPTPTLTGEVEALRGTPKPTVPPTDSEQPLPARPADSGRAALLVLAALLASALVVEPAARARIRRRD